ncbi:hypothetical protein TEHOK1_09690 [Tetragenococcus halophilus]|nr:hypothetical protein TEHD23766T_1998 [Tetragenococcus halophilus subsp. flandriensis]GMG66252.1 hypothetical protein TEHIT2_14430 [Tetragenococcus halophilus]GMG68997.1 hypothetical protein TEHMS4_19330 [Tetragenococcus halophilus]GMG70280.1 hypothetical protein TEHOK1_09690 [Tetragenococcus halophilus]
MSADYDNPAFFDAYASMDRSKYGLDAAGEWHKLKEILSDFTGKTVLNLGYGYGWHCRYAEENGANQVIRNQTKIASVATIPNRISGPKNIGEYFSDVPPI